jgi:hypothetical protein
LGSIFGQVFLNNFRNDGDYSALGWTLVGSSGLILGAALCAWMWIPRVQRNAKVKNKFPNVFPNATLEEIAVTALRPFVDDGDGDDVGGEEA